MKKHLSLLLLLLLLPAVLPTRALGGPPLTRQFGKVVDAETGMPLIGVRIIAIDEGVPDYDISPTVEETLSDSLGQYGLTLQGSAWVAFVAPGFGTARMVYPSDLVECDSCCGKLKDVKLER